MALPCREHNGQAVGSLTSKEIRHGIFKEWIGKLFGSQHDSFANKTIDTLKKVKGKAQKMKVRTRDAKGGSSRMILIPQRMRLGQRKRESGQAGTDG